MTSRPAGANAERAEPAEEIASSALSASSAFRPYLVAVTAILVALAPAVDADNCSGPADCEATADYNNGIAIGGGIVAVIISIIVSTFSPPGTGTVIGPGVGTGAGPPDPFGRGNLTENDGRWPDVPKGHVWWPGDGGQWVSPKDADRLVGEREEGIRRAKEAADREREWTAKEDARNEETWRRNKEWSEQGTKDRARELQKEADNEQAILERERQRERDRIRRQELEEQQQENFKDQERHKGWGVVKEEFWDKTTKEVDELPRDIQNLGRDLVRGGFKAAEDAVKGVTDPENWRIAAETVGGTAWDAVTGPIKLAAGDKQAWDNVVNSVDTVTKVGGHIVNEIKKDPVEFVKGLTPIKAWEEAMDPNKPLIERIGRTWWATVDTVLTVGGPGKLIGKGGAKAAEGVADDLVDAATKAFREGKLPPKITPDRAKELADLNKEWEKTRAIAKGRVTEYDRARRAAEEAAAKGDDAAAAIARQKQRDAAIKLQGDKVSLQEINKRKPETIQAFKDDMKDVYDKTDDKMVEWARKDKGYGPITSKETKPDGTRIFRDDKGNEIHIAEPTNPTKPGDRPKAGADRDYTMRTKDAVGKGPGKGMEGPPRPPGPPKDMDYNKVQDAYNDRFFEAAGGKPMTQRTGLPDDPEKFTHKMDQLATGGKHPEMYGTTQRDLDAAIKDKGMGFSDSPQIGGAIGYKGDHWVGKGTQTDIYEGMRQTTKQYDNQAMGRMQAMEKHVADLKAEGAINKDFAVKPPPPRLQEGIDIMKRVKADEISPAQAVEDLKRINMSPQDVSRGVGDYVDSLQRAAPPVLRQKMGVP